MPRPSAMASTKQTPSGKQARAPSRKAAADARTTASRAPSVNRAVQILRLLATAESPLGVNAIARSVDAVPSTCLHILRALQDEGLLYCDPESKRYSLGLGLVSLAGHALNSAVQVPMLGRELAHLARVSGATAIAAQLAERDRMVIVAVSHGPGTFGVHFDIGRRFPSYVSATGRCVAAHSALGNAALRRKFDALHWDDPPRFEDWLKEVELARREGVGIDRGNYVRGYLILAAPVFQDGKMVRALSIVAASGQLPPDRMEEVKEELRTSARRVSV